MSKDNVFHFFTKVAQKEPLQEKLQSVSSPQELVELGKEEGFEFSSENLDEALTELKQKPGFWSKLAEAALAVFSPAHDNYPNIGVQPFSGDANEST
jgi:predicted ribosomally synthesized peptide with nif11-like leader